MIRFENTVTPSPEQWAAIIRGVRNPKNSWKQSDSYKTRMESANTDLDTDFEYFIGEKDLDLMMRLRQAGTDHRKYMRMIPVYVDITSNHTWWAEFDTYKVGTVRNSCSKMHKVHVKEFAADDFSHEGIDQIPWMMEEFERTISNLEKLRVLYNETLEKKYWRAIIEYLPLGFNLKATIMLNYEVLANIYNARKGHKMDEWHDFREWIESLPYAELITA